LTHLIGRREFLRAGGALCLSGALSGCGPVLRSGPSPQASAAPRPAATLALPRLRASTDRITAITVCTRPFRAAGPRLDVEQLGRKTVVHNYGHGGSGWSLSWGAAAVAVEKAMASGERDIGVIGCGAIGLTSAVALQRAGARVTIYTKELPPSVPSSRATGLWTPDSRICLESNATTEFKQLWERMARKSYATYQSFLGLAGTPVEYIDFYGVHDGADTQAAAPSDSSRPQFAELQRELLPDLQPKRDEYGPGQHPLGARYLSGAPILMFNLSAYQQTLIADFRNAGGEIRIQEFHAPADFARIPEKTLINATGYGARALLGDQSVVPVRGQLARVIPQPEIHYGLYYRHTSFVPRRDGAVFQVLGESDYYGFGDESAVADRAEAEHAVTTIAGLFANS
jgi:glycine/D-amino acid oxidase-like deaminating enzyme